MRLAKLLKFSDDFDLLKYCEDRLPFDAVESLTIL